MQTQELITLTLEKLPSLRVGSQTELTLVPITNGASDRSYFRLSGLRQDVILMHYTDRRPDNLKFLPATRLFSRLGIPVPHVLAEDEALKLIWLEDLGKQDLWSLREQSWQVRRSLYVATLASSARLHSVVVENELSEGEQADLAPPFDASLYEWEQDYFLTHAVQGLLKLPRHEVETTRFQEMMQTLRQELSEVQPRRLVHRDFHSQNILTRSGLIWFIDYQGVRLGVPEYDLASLLYDPYVRLTASEREELYHFYRLARGQDPWDPELRRQYALAAAQRLMQALGAYGNLSLNLGRQEFLAHVKPAAQNLVLAIQEISELDPLRELVQGLETWES